MNGKLIGLASLVVLCQAAFAQSNVTVYGIVDTGIVVGRGGPKGSEMKLESGVSNGSRLGLRGSEALGNGMSGIFTLESGILNDTGALDQGGLLFGRQAFVGLESRQGTLTMGRQYTPIYSALLIADPFGNNFGGASGQLMANEKAGVRMNNTLMYSSPSVNGFNGQLAYGFGEVAGDSAKSRQIGAAVGYANGPLTVRIAHNRTNNATATDASRNALVVGKFDFGTAVASAGYGINKGIGAVDSRDILLGVTVPFGADAVMASYIRKDDHSSLKTDGNQMAMAYTHALSKRTVAYAALAKLSNTNFTTTKFAAGDREIDLGIRHAF